jgi:MFS transporter, DHA2 family, multidrug resistance protein
MAPAPMDFHDGLPRPERIRALITIAIAVAMSVLDASIANIALPVIARELSATPAGSIWVVNAYQLAVTVSLLPFASLGEIFGYRRVYTLGLAVFSAASLGCAVSTSLPMLVLMRLVQGFGGAGIMSVNTALVRFVFPRSMLGRAVGFTAFVVATSSATGPTVAAAVLSVASWHWLFAINVPLGALALYLAAGSLPRAPRARYRFNFSSAVLNAITLGLLVVGIDELGRGERPAWAAAQLAGAVVVGALFIQHQRKVRVPMLPIDLFRRPVFALSVATSICSFTAQSLVYVSLPFLFEDVGHMSQIMTGLLITPWPAVVVFVAPLAGRLSDQSSPGALGAMGLMVMTIGLVLLLLMPVHATWPDIAWRMAVAGFGFGFFQSPNNKLLVGSAPPERSGGASGMLSTARLLGQTNGSALVALCFGVSAATGTGVAGGTHLSLAIGAAAAALGTCISLLRLRQLQLAAA